MNPPEIGKIVGNKLQHRGFVYTRSRKQILGEPSYWECTRLRRSKSCRARAVTLGDGAEVEVTKFSSHEHPPDQEQCQADQVMERMKRKAEDEPAAGPSKIIRDELRDVPAAVISRLPDRQNIKKVVRRVRRVALPPNPRRIEELGELPDRFRNTLQGERFLISDNNEVNNRVIVFATRRNLELLSRSTRWYLDGTFKVFVTKLAFCNSQIYSEVFLN